MTDDQQMTLDITTNMVPDVVDVKVSGTFAFEAADAPSWVPEEEVFVVLRCRVSDVGFKIDAKGDLHRHGALRFNLLAVVDPHVGHRLFVEADRAAKDAAGFPQLPLDEDDEDWEFPERAEDTADISSVR